MEGHNDAQTATRVWSRKRRTSAQCASLRTITVGFPVGYPIIYYSHPESRSNSAQTLLPTLTPLRSGRAARPPTHGILPVRASRSVTAHTDPAVTVMRDRGACSVYPGAVSQEREERLRTPRTYPGGMVGYPPLPSPAPASLSALFSLSATYEASSFCHFCSKLHIHGARP